MKDKGLVIDKVGEMNTLDTLVKDNVKSKKISDTKHPPNLGHFEKKKLKNNRNRRIGRIPVQMPRNYLQQDRRRKFSNLNKMPMKVQEAYRIPNRLDQKRKSSCYVIIKH